MKLTQKWNSLFCFFLLTACGVGNLRNPNKAELLEAKDPSENGSRIEEFKMYDEPFRIIKSVNFDAFGPGTPKSLNT